MTPGPPAQPLGLRWRRARRLLGAAATRRVRLGAARVRASGWAVVQCAVAAGIAYQLASSLLGHPRPMFAAVAAIVALGLSHTQRLRRVGELGVGVAMGVAIGDLVVREIGGGAWQLAVIAAVGMVLAQFLDGGAVITNQAALQAVFVSVLPPPPGGNITRWEDAAVGALTALAVAAVAPPDPRRAAAERSRLLLGTLADLSTEAAAAIRFGNPALAATALEHARATQAALDGLADAVRSGEEISRISPLRRHRRGDLARYAAAHRGIDLTARNLRVATRRVLGALQVGEPMPVALADVLDDLSRSLRAVRRELAGAAPPGTACAALTDLAGRLDPGSLGATSMSATVVVAQVRSAVVDLLSIFGVPLEQARALLPPPERA